jgi:hypothetical protein
MVDALENLSGEDIRLMRGGEKGVSRVRLCLNAVEMRRVIGGWDARVSSDPSLAVAMLDWAAEGIPFGPADVSSAIAGATPLLLDSRKTRDKYRDIISKIPIDSRPLQAVLKEDARADELARLESERRVLEREKYLDALADLPFSERISKLALERPMLRFKDLRREWSKVGTNELDALDSAELGKLISACEELTRYLSQEVFSILYRRRHSLRLAARDRLRERYKGKSARDLLDILVRDVSVPLEDYPIELAQAVCREWLGIQGDELRRRFMDMLEKSSYRVWQRVRRRL